MVLRSCLNSISAVSLNTNKRNLLLFICHILANIALRLYIIVSHFGGGRLCSARRFCCVRPSRARERERSPPPKCPIFLQKIRLKTMLSTTWQWHKCFSPKWQKMLQNCCSSDCTLCLIFKSVPNEDKWTIWK